MTQITQINADIISGHPPNQRHLRSIKKSAVIRSISVISVPLKIHVISVLLKSAFHLTLSSLNNNVK
jgi:hypothetical protein